MFLWKKLVAVALLVGVAACSGGGGSDGDGGDRAELNREATASLQSLYVENDAAQAVGEQARGILVFPNIVKGGLVGVTGETGNGVLFVDGQPTAYYNVTSAGFGFALGVQAYSQALMFMTDDALDGFRNSGGWEAGVDGSVAVLDVGATVEADTNNLQTPIVGFVYGQAGLLANATIEGSKYTQIDP